MASAPNKLKIALVQDWLYGGGAEKVMEQLHQLYPNAPIYTSYCSPEWRKRLDNKVITGYLQNRPFNHLRKFLPLLRQWWFTSLDLSDYDIIISNSGNGEAKFIKTREDAVHISYCNTPPHFYWRKYQDYLKNPGFGKLNFLARFGLRILVKPLRKRDYNAAQNVDYFIANSNHIAADIKSYYDRDSVIIFPPVDVVRFTQIKHSKADRPRFIVWGRHVPDKRLDLAVQACSNLGLDLTVIGKGSETANLQKLAGPSVAFHGFTEDDELDKLVANSDVFIFTSLEDFGIAPVEAMAAGLPVIAYRGGGALDYIVDGKTGLFFNDQTVESLEKALKNLSVNEFDANEIKKFATKFSDQNFRANFDAFLAQTLAKKSKK